MTTIDSKGIRNQKEEETKKEEGEPKKEENFTAENRSKIINHESKGQYTNNHLLHIKTGVATEDQLRTALKSAIAEASKITKKKHDGNLDGRFIINIVKDRSEATYGYAYVWIVSPEIFYMIIGRNPDGSERFQLVDDPNWIPPESNSSNWADISDLENPPKIRKPLPPLVKLPSYQFTEEQKKSMTDKGTAFGTHGQFECGPTFVSEVEAGFQPNVLYGKSVPIEFTSEDLKSLFLPFVSDQTKKYVKRSKGIVSEESYPLVSITAKRAAFITFDLGSHDACFALKMARKMSVRKDGISYTLLFNRAFKFKNKEDARPSTSPVEYFDS